MKRREFIKKAGLSSAALASLPVAAGGLTSPAWADDDDEGTLFRFVVVSVTPTGSDFVAINGAGKFGDSWIRGRGSFTHWVPTATGPPFPIVAAGYWRATSLVGFETNGVYGTLESGILELGATFRATIPAPARLPAELRVVCNVGPGALMTGEHEGVHIHVAGFEFEPLEPELGLTIFVPAPG
jgi:hypothetical protein